MGNKQQRKVLAKKEFKKPVTKFEPIDLNVACFVPKGMTRAYKNTRYIVMVYDNHPVSTGFATCALIQKHDDTPIVRHWSEIQKIKNEIFGENTVAIEYYPAQNDLVDEHNIYWIWLFPKGVLPMPTLKG